MKTAYGVFKTVYANGETQVHVSQITEIEGEVEGTVEWVCMVASMRDCTDICETESEANAIAQLVSLETATPLDPEL